MAATVVTSARQLVSTLRCLLVVVLVTVLAGSINMKSAQYEITTTWNNVSIDAKDYVRIELIHDRDLIINVSAPFYNDPALPDWSHSPATMDKLYNYEVVEVFLLDSDASHYLEIELSPKGQYLLLQLNGYRNVTNSGLPLKSYITQIDDNRWHASARVDSSLLPRNVAQFNAYAIHGSNETRQYLSLFPAPTNDSQYLNPDFHRLDLFKAISIFE